MSGDADTRARRISRIRWRSRRGTRELDVLLGRFLDSRLDGLDTDALEDLERLLETQDPDLQAWLTGEGLPTDGALARLVHAIRAIPGAR